METLAKFADCYMAQKLNNNGWFDLDRVDKEIRLKEAIRKIKAIDGICMPKEFDDEFMSAICEVAYEVNKESDTEVFEQYQRAGVTSLSYGNDSVSFGGSGNIALNGGLSGSINEIAYSILRKYIQRSFPIV